MLARFRSAIAVLLAYAQANPGAVSLVGSGLIAALAHFGLHVSTAQLAAIVAALLPLVVGLHVAVRRADAKASAKPAEK